MHRNFVPRCLSLMFLLLVFVSFSFGDEAMVGVKKANQRVGHPENAVAGGMTLRLIAQGSDELENPSGILTAFGYLGDGATQPVEPTKTEPDENTYVVLDHNPGGPTAGFDYGRHFLFQGHELFGSSMAYITRINLDVTDAKHRITLLTPVGKDGKTHLSSIDGSTWNPHTKTLLFTQEAGSSGGVAEIGPNWGSKVHRLHGILGRGGYEGIHPDDHGNLYLAEDAGGTSVNVNPSDSASPKAARNPNSFIFKFVPNNPSNLRAGGRLQALHVTIDGKPLKFIAVDGDHPTGDVFSEAQKKLHTPGTSYQAKWITVHDTDVDGTADFDANAAAKTAGATPFKRPENLQFRPGSGFGTFYFDSTGDTSKDSGSVPDLAARGAWGAIFRVDIAPTSDNGKISIVVLGSAVRAAFDNVAFLDENTLLVAEDRGDTLHRQLNRLDSIWAFDIRKQNPHGARLLALGRDSASEKDVQFGEAGTPGFQNEGDNEPTGLHVSDGTASVSEMQGTTINPEARRIFFTQQHGLNRVYEILLP